MKVNKLAVNHIKIHLNQQMADIRCKIRNNTREINRISQEQRMFKKELTLITNLINELPKESEIEK